MSGQDIKNTHDVAKDVDALRENFVTDSKSVNLLQWLVFTIIFLFIVSAAIWALRPNQPNRPDLIYNAGVEFETPAPNASWMSEATEQSLNSYLDIGGQTQVINFEQRTEDYSPPKKDADWVLSGVLSQTPDAPDQLTMTLKLQSQKSSNKIFETQLAGLSTGLSDLSARASAQIYTWLEQQPLTADERANARAEFPINTEAQAAYAKGYQALLSYDSKAAADLFETALDVGGDHPIVYNRLARVYSHMGHRAKAKAAHIKAYEAREGLSRSRQLELEAHYLSSTSKKKRAREVFTALKEFHPYELSYRLHIVSIYQLGAKPDLAMAEIDEMRTLAEPYRSDPRIDISEARIWYQLGHYEKGRDAAHRGADKARELGNKGLLAEALLNSGNADRNLYLEQLLEARALYEEIGNPDKLAGVLSSLGNHEKGSGRLKEAEAYFQQAIDISKAAGNEPRVIFVKNSLAIVLDLQGRLSDGLEMKQEVLDYYRERNNKVRHSIMLENVNISLFKLGRLEDAEIILDEALSVFTEIKDSIGVAWTPMYRARIRSRQGHLAEAETLANTALKNSEANPEGGLEQEARFLLAEIKFWRGEYDQARDEFTDIAKAFSEANNVLHAADARHMLARISMRQGDYETAKSELEAAHAIYKEAESHYYILDTHSTKADLAFLKFRDEIEPNCEALSKRIKGQEFTNIVLRARIRLAQCSLAHGKTEASTDEALVKIEKEAASLGLFEPQIDAKILRRQLPNSNLETINLSEFANSRGWNIDWALR